jgi:hypothetical protein
MARHPTDLPDRLPNTAPLTYAPENEQGVVFLFSHLAKTRFGLRIERIQAGYPDCVAYRDGKRVRIEFEYRSRNFVQHKHDPKDCDWIVCWIHDWPAAPTKLRIVELRKYFGLGFNVWIQPVGTEYKEILSGINRDDAWSVPSLATKGDLLLFHRTKPDSYIQDIFRVAGPVVYRKAGWKPGNDWMASIRRVTSLKTPIHISELKRHRVLRDSGFVRGSIQGRPRITAHWPELFEMICDRNPSAKRVLAAFGPDRLV